MRGRKYSAPGIDVYYDARICIHVRECVRGLPAVFDPNERPWIRPQNATPDELAALVLRCPTGALHIDRPEPVGDDVMTIATNGPLYVRGDVIIVDHGGTPVRHDTRVALCRCGDSKNKPFCDNSHIAKGFQG